MTGLLPTLASFVPSLVIRRYNAGLTSLDEPSAENFPALVLFADISGFTALTERLAARGPSGAEDLTRYLNTYFGELIALITEAGGDVVKFAGDALLALWPAQRDDELPALAQTVADSARRIQARLHRFEVGDEVALSLKVAIGAGQIAAMQLGGVFKRWELLVAGAPLSQVGVANGEAEPGDVVLSAEAWALLARKPAATALAQGVMRLVASAAPPMTAPLTRVTALPETPGCPAPIHSRRHSRATRRRSNRLARGVAINFGGLYQSAGFHLRHPAREGAAGDLRLAGRAIPLRGQHQQNQRGR